MKVKTVRQLSKAFIVLSALALCLVSLMAFYDPQLVMNPVQIKLSNNDAYSAIRGIYGGAGASIVLLLIYLLICHVRLGLGFLCALWGFHTLSRLITIAVQGPLGRFGIIWLMIEFLLFSIALTLYLACKRKTPLDQPLIKH